MARKIVDVTRLAIQAAITAPNGDKDTMALFKTEREFREFLATEPEGTVAVVKRWTR